MGIHVMATGQDTDSKHRIHRSPSTASRTSIADVSKTAATVQLARNASQHNRQHNAKVPLKPGSLVPKTCVLLKGEGTEMRSFFAHRRGVLFGGPGAFTPACSERHMIGFRDYAAQIRQAKIDFIGSIYVNDPYVLKAWARCKKVQDQFTFISDVEGRLTSALGLMAPVKSKRLGPRARQFAMVIGHGGVVEWVAVDVDCYAENVLTFLGVDLTAIPHAIIPDTPLAATKEVVSPWAVTNGTMELEPVVTRTESMCSDACGSIHVAESIPLGKSHSDRSHTGNSQDGGRTLGSQDGSQAGGSQDGSQTAESQVEDSTIDELTEANSCDQGNFTETQLTSQEINIAMLRGFIIEASVRNDKLSGKNFATIVLGSGESDDPTFSVDYSARPGLFTSWYLPRNLRLTVNLSHWNSGFGTLRYNGQDYIAMGFHIVGPSPHKLDDQPDFARNIELRILHVPVAKTANHKCRMLVLALTFNPPPFMASERDNLLAVNPMINQILDIPTLASDTFEAFQFGSSALTGGKFDLECMFQNQEAEFLKYEGVLSALGERVTWIIRKDCLSISRTQQVRLEEYLYIMSSVAVPDPLVCLKLARVVRYLPRFSHAKVQSGKVIIEALRKKLYAVMYLSYVILRSSYNGLLKEEEFSFWIHVLREHFGEQRAENEDFLNTLRRASIMYPLNVDLMKRLANLPLRDTEFIRRFLSVEDCVRVIDSLKTPTSTGGSSTHSDCSPHNDPELPLLKKGVTLGRHMLWETRGGQDDAGEDDNGCNVPPKADSMSSFSPGPSQSAHISLDHSKMTGRRAGSADLVGSSLPSAPPGQNWGGPFWAASNVTESPTCPTSPIRQPSHRSPECGAYDTLLGGELHDGDESTPQPKYHTPQDTTPDEENTTTPVPMNTSTSKIKPDSSPDAEESDHSENSDSSDLRKADVRPMPGQLKCSSQSSSSSSSSSRRSSTSSVSAELNCRAVGIDPMEQSDAESLSNENEKGNREILSSSVSEDSRSEESSVDDRRYKGHRSAPPPRRPSVGSESRGPVVRSAMKGSRQLHEQQQARNMDDQDRLDLVEFMVTQLAKNQSEDMTDEVTLANTNMNSVARKVTRKELRRLSEAEARRDDSQSRSRREIRFARNPEEFSEDPWTTYDRRVSRELRLRGRKATGHPATMMKGTSARLQAMRRDDVREQPEEEPDRRRQARTDVQKNKSRKAVAVETKSNGTRASRRTVPVSTTTSGEDQSDTTDYSGTDTSSNVGGEMTPEGMSSYLDEDTAPEEDETEQDEQDEDYQPHRHSRKKVVRRRKPRTAVVLSSDLSSTSGERDRKNVSRRRRSVEKTVGKAVREKPAQPLSRRVVIESDEGSQCTSSVHRKKRGSKRMSGEATLDSGQRTVTSRGRKYIGERSRDVEKARVSSASVEDYVYEGRMSNGVRVEMKLRFEDCDRRWFCYMTVGLQKAKLSVVDLKEMVKMMSGAKKGRVNEVDLELKNILEKSLDMMKKLKNGSRV